MFQKMKDNNFEINHNSLIFLENCSLKEKKKRVQNSMYYTHK